MVQPGIIEKRDFGPTGMRFSVLGLGTWEMEREGPAAVKALQRGIDEGANHIDTAEMYGSGRAEQIVGKAVKGRRESVFLVSKVLPSNATYEKTLEACERSLRNLGTEYLDVYLLHWRERRTPLEETFRAFDKLVQGGKIRAFGVSNFDVKDMEEAVQIAGPGNIACNQVLYHLHERAIEYDLLPWCVTRGIALVAYSPLGQGKLPANHALRDLALARNTTPSQVALAFLIRHPNVFAIPKSSHVEHVAENMRAGALQLTAKEIRHIEEAFPAQKRRSLPML